MLVAGDVPTGLVACSSSGALEAYIEGLMTSDPALSARMSSEWLDLKSLGALDGAVALFTNDPSACTAELASAPKVKSAASVVIVFGSEAAADRAWQAGVFGFVPPAADQVSAGIRRGTATGLGASSWTYDRSPVRLACWRRSVFVALVVLDNLDAAAFKSTTAAVDAHLH